MTDHDRYLTSRERRRKARDWDRLSPTTRMLIEYVVPGAAPYIYNATEEPDPPRRYSLPLVLTIAFVAFCNGFCIAWILRG